MNGGVSMSEYKHLLGLWLALRRRCARQAGQYLRTDSGPGLFRSSPFFGHQQGLNDVPGRSAVAHQLPQCDRGFDCQKYFDSPVAAGFLLCPALSGAWSADAATGLARMSAIGALMLSLGRGCSRRMLGCFHRRVLRGVIV
jgi:hypothetical protein